MKTLCEADTTSNSPECNWSPRGENKKNTLLPKKSLIGDENFQNSIKTINPYIKKLNNSKKYKEKLIKTNLIKVLKINNEKKIHYTKRKKILQVYNLAAGFCRNG